MSPSDPHPSTRTFTPAREEAEVAANATSSAQTEDPAYRLAFQDMDFLLREDLRPVRFQLELLKPELLLDEAKIASTPVIYGSAPLPQTPKARPLNTAGRARQPSGACTRPPRCARPPRPGAGGWSPSGLRPSPNIMTRPGSSPRSQAA